MKSEKTITASIVHYLLKLCAAGEPVWFFKVHGGPMQRAGVPDLYVLYRGVGYWLEIKTEIGVVSPLQERTMGLIRKAGGQAHVVRSVEDVEAVLNQRPESVGLVEMTMSEHSSIIYVYRDRDREPWNGRFSLASADSGHWDEHDGHWSIAGDDWLCDLMPDQAERLGIELEPCQRGNVVLSLKQFPA